VLKEGLETGYFELVGTVTHLGHSVESGHYMAWIKENEEEWTKYDDNTVYQQSSEKVTQLRGGQPNLEIAYVLLFRKVFAKPL
jgi:ubiquitin carboxyl-terminal hydrolase 14